MHNDTEEEYNSNKTAVEMRVEQVGATTRGDGYHDRLRRTPAPAEHSNTIGSCFVSPAAKHAHDELKETHKKKKKKTQP